MLFNSLEFLLVFLPLAVAGFYLIPGADQRRLFIIVVSIVFYSIWDWRLTPVLVCSLVGNYLIAKAYWHFRRGEIIVAGCAANLLLLGVFKYADFFADQIALLSSTQPRVHWDLALPLGISFFTFQAIIYLVDLRRGQARPYTWREYGSYITFFPHLIAGPIVRHDELVGQFDLHPSRDGLYERCFRGLLLLLLGLMKKVFIADPAALIANAGFAAPQTLTGAEAWLSALAFSMQIYFDFSGYSDMAIGLALLFGFTFPINFNAPYRATSIADFWRRWHITLSRLLRDYLYIPLGGSRRGLPRTVAALLVTMILGGLWHGAGWTFLAWGALHGLALASNHVWRRAGWTMPSPLGWLLTMLLVVVGWVFFRAQDFSAAFSMLKAMAGLQVGKGTTIALSEWNLGLIAAAVSISVLGPTSQALAFDLVRPRIWLALGAGLVAGAVLLKVSDGDYVPFIYFAF